MEQTAETTQRNLILQMKGINKTFPGVRALQDVSLDLLAGEIHGLVGKNGAGKSTLMSVLMGLQEPDSGEIIVGGRSFRAMTPNEAVKSGIAYVPQRVNMMDCLTVAENILAGDLPKGRFGLIDWKEVNAEAERRLRNLGLALNVRNRVEGLSVAEQTMLAIAKALFGNARLIILDEPTASLPRADINKLFSFIRSLKSKGIAFIYISHHLEEVFEICDRVTVLRDGCLVDVCNVAELTMPELVRLLVGENIKEYERASTIRPETCLTIRDLTRRGYFENINLSLKKGEIVGISGLQGSGAETLAKALFAMEQYGLGQVEVNGKRMRASDPSQAFAQGLAYLPQDRYRFGLVGSRTVRENVTYPILTRFARAFGLLNETTERSIVQTYVEGLGIATPSQEQTARLLSGGNQQKVVFAKLAATKPAVLILHEPTQGIDVRAKVDIYRIIDELAAQGVGTIIISSEVRELIGVCDRILVMYEGRITREFKRGDPQMTPENILLAIEGGNSDHSKA